MIVILFGRPKRKAIERDDAIRFLAQAVCILVMNVDGHATALFARRFHQLPKALETHLLAISDIPDHTKEKARR